ncbi:MAG: EamA family transporter [Gammaproteobacteria bacterium]
MTPLLVALVLAAALLHAVWNAMAKSGGQPELSIASYQLVGSVICIALVPLIPAPDPASWKFLFASVVIHNVYYFALARAYRSGDLSQIYPLVRGLAPVLVTLAAAVFAGEWLAPGVVLGIALVSAGVVSLAFMGRHLGVMSPAGRRWALITSVLIGLYTVTDGLGVRAAGSEIGYIAWLFVFEVVPIGSIIAVTQARAWIAYLRGAPARALGGGIASSCAYGLVIFAMSLGPMAIVSSLRETSVIFAALIGSLFLREPFSRARIRAAILVAAGVIAMRLLG